MDTILRRICQECGNVYYILGKESGVPAFWKCETHKGMIGTKKNYFEGKAKEFAYENKVILDKGKE